MKKNILFFFLIITGIYSAQQLENPGFESWEDVGTVADEPVEWSSIKTANASSLVISGAPVIWGQGTGADAHSGNYSIRLENKSSFGVVATGTLTNGRIYATFVPSEGYVYTDQSNTDWNKTFTARPDSMVGWYKYAPQAGDHGKVEVILHTGNGQNPENGTAGNFVARARFETPTSNVSSWTRFSVPFNYYQSGNPQYALAVLAAGDSTIAKDGSIAFYDDIEFIYLPVAVEITEQLKAVRVFSSGQNIYVNALESLIGASLTIYDISGREVMSSTLSSTVQAVEMNHPNGIYLCEVRIGGSRIVKKVILE